MYLYVKDEKRKSKKTVFSFSIHTMCKIEFNNGSTRKSGKFRGIRKEMKRL